MRVNFNPSYENFLMVREQLLSSLGTRFQVENEQVAMDNLLKAHLSSLGRNVFNATSDEAVSKALQRGNTYWYYKIKDTTDTLSVILSYRSVKESDHLRRPELELFYAWKKVWILGKRMKKPRKLLYYRTKYYLCLHLDRKYSYLT